MSYGVNRSSWSKLFLLQNFMNIDGTTLILFFRPLHVMQGLRRLLQKLNMKIPTLDCPRNFFIRKPYFEILIDFYSMMSKTGFKNRYNLIHNIQILYTWLGSTRFWKADSCSTRWKARYWKDDLLLCWARGNLVMIYSI